MLSHQSVLHSHSHAVHEVAKKCFLSDEAFVDAAVANLAARSISYIVGIRTASPLYAIARVSSDALDEQKICRKWCKRVVEACQSSVAES